MACPCHAPEAALPRFASALSANARHRAGSGFLTVLAQSRHQEAVIEIVEQAPDVELHHPVLVPATASGDGDRLQRRFPRPIAIGVVDGRSDQACGSSHILIAVCAILSDTIGMPSTRTPPDFLGIGTAFTGGGK